MSEAPSAEAPISGAPHATPAARARVQVGKLHADAVTMAGALDAIDELVAAGKGGSVFTPNVDHVVLAEGNPAFAAAYAGVSLSLADGKPIIWASQLMGSPLPAKVSGSDFVLPLAERAAQRGHRLYLLGGGPGVAERAAEALVKRFPKLVIAGTSAPFLDLDLDPGGARAAAEAVRATRPDLVYVGFGAPKQEMWIHRHADILAPAVALGIGASLDFLAGNVARAPRWISDAGLEWLYRLAKEPRRLWKRYLVRDPQFLFILGRMLREQRSSGAR